MLNQLLFVIGNGYDVNEETGLLVDDSGKHLHEMRKMTQKQKDKLLAACYAKERDFYDTMKQIWGSIMTSHGRDFDAEFQEACAQYKVVDVTDEMFTEEALYKELVQRRSDLQESDFAKSESGYVRPYPLSENYSDVYNLSEKTPVWMLEIARNFCNAWVRFLKEELANNNVYETNETNYANREWTKIICA